MSYSVIDLPAKEIVFQQGEPGRLMYLVQEGEVEILQDLGGHERQIAVLERGDFFGEMAVLEREVRSHSVRTLTPAKLVEIDRAGFQHMLQRNSEIAVRMVRKLSGRLTQSQDMVLRAYAGRAAIEEAPKTVAGRARLVAVESGTEFPLPDRPQLTIGRKDPANDIYPDVDLSGIDPQLTTSRRHALLLRRGEGFYIQEERATNGTYVNGQRISAEGPLEIRSGDEIAFGAVPTRFVVD